MEEDDKSIILSLRKTGCDIDDKIISLKDFSTELKVSSALQCLKTIRNIDEKFTNTYPLPFWMDKVAKYLQDLGYKTPIGHETFLSSNESEIRKVFKFLVDKLPENAVDKAGRRGDQEQENVKTFLMIASAAVCAVILICLNVGVIVSVLTSNISQSVDTVTNIQTSFNKLGIKLSSNAGDEYKTAATALVVLEFLSTAIIIILGCGVFLCCINEYEACWKCKAPYLIVGCIGLGLIIGISVCVHTLRPSESSEINKPALSQSLQDSYKDDSFPSPGNADSDTWNEIFIDFQCCAVNAVKSTTNDFDLTPWCTTSGSCQQTNSQIPKACCKGVDKTSYTSAPSDCHEYVNSGYYHEQGCATVWSKAVENLEEDKKIIYGLGIAAAVVHCISYIPSLILVLAFVKDDKKISNNNKA